MEQSADTNRVIAEHAQREMEHHELKETKQLRAVKELTASATQMTLFAAGFDSETVPDDLPDTFLRFINCKSEARAEHKLNVLFESLGIEDAAWSTGLTHSLYVGQFLWADQCTPSNFSAFSFFSLNSIDYGEKRIDQHHRHILCHLVQTQGQGKTLDELTNPSNKK